MRALGSARAVGLSFLLVGLALAMPASGCEDGGDRAEVVQADSSAPRASATIAIAKLHCRTLSCSDGWSGIALVDADGDRLRVLSRHRGWLDDDPAVSPDGRYIAFSRTKNQYRSYQVHLMRTDGSDVRRISSGRFDERPTWSPSGRWILYQSARGLRLIRPSGKGRRAVPRTEGAAWPAWTPGGRIAFYRGGYVWTASVNGTGRRRLVKGREPDFSPDGRTVVYTLPNGGVAKARSDGSGTRMLSKGMYPDFSPDGQHIAYVRWPGGNDFSVWVMRADGSGQHRLIDDARHPDWNPLP